MKRIPILLIGIVAVSTASIFIKMAQADVSSIVIAAYRLCLAVLIMTPLSIGSMRVDLKSNSIGYLQIGLIVLSGTFLAFHFITWITSLEHTSVTSSVVLVTTTPIWVAILTPRLLKVSIKKNIVFGIGVALFGGLIIAIGDAGPSHGNEYLAVFKDLVGSSYARGNLLALSGALFASGYIIIGKILRKNISILSYTFMVYSTAAIVLLVCVFVTGQKVFGYSNDTYLWLLLIALVPQAIGHSIFNWALKYLSAAFVSIALIGEPIGAIILAMIFLNEYPTPIELTGGGLILLGIVVAALNEKKGDLH